MSQDETFGWKGDKIVSKIVLPFNFIIENFKKTFRINHFLGQLCHMIRLKQNISQVCMLMMFTVSISSQPEQLSSFKKV